MRDERNHHGGVLAVGHRGDPVGHVENTIEAFEAARRLGADMVELDCRLTRDGRVAVLHDATLERLWGVRKALADLEWADVRRIRLDGQHVPLFEDVLGAFPLPIMVDLPDPRAAGPALSVAEAAGALDRCLFAGQTAGLAHIRERSDAARIALTWDKSELPSRELLKRVKPEWWNPYHRLATRKAIEWAHHAGMAVSVWTVDSRAAIARALDAGASAIISNRVATVVQELAGRRKRPPATP